MKSLKRDPFERPVRDHAPGRRPRWAGVMLLLAMFAAISLLILSRLEHPLLRHARSVAAEWLAPVLEAASVPTSRVAQLRQQVQDYVSVFAEIDRLKLENQQLQQYVWRAQMLEAENARYRSMLNAVAEPGLAFVTARVIADSRGVFVRSVLINAGSKHGLRNGFAVINADGLVGRIVETSDSVARVLLLSDLNSRLPVLVGTAGARAILHGDNGINPTLEHLAATASIKSGDAVFTSGQDGILPMGLRIGTVASQGDRLVVQTHAALDALDYVSVLQYDAPVLDLLQAAEGGAMPSGSASLAARTPAHNAPAAIAPAPKE